MRHSTGSVIAALLLTAALTACNRRDEHSMTPLMHAAQRGDTIELKKLLRRNADTEARVEPHNSMRALFALLMWMQDLPDRKPGWTALMFAVDSSRHDAARILLNAGADPSVEVGKINALGLAVFKNDTRMVRLLLERGAKITSGTGYLTHPIIFAAQNNDTSLLRLLLAHGAPVDYQDRGLMTPLMIAAQTGAKEAVEMLLHAHANANLTDRNGWTAARYALDRGHDDIARLLGSSDNARTDAANQRLFDAIKAADPAALSAALKDGADPNAVQKDGRSALMEAVGPLPESSAFDLIEAGARINKKEAGPLLFVSVVRGHHKLFDKLIDMGEKPHDSYIADAVRARQLEMVKRLLAMGLDRNARDATGHTALELAQLRGDSQMIRLLQ